jgi:predicted Zn-ribbon and HTH transcriptional regulator
MAFKLFFPYSYSTVIKDTMNGILAVLDDELIEGHYKIEDNNVYDLDKHEASKEYLAATLEEIKDLPECEVCHRQVYEVHSIYGHKQICPACANKMADDIEKWLDRVAADIWRRPQTCKKCDHVWTPRKPKEPETCPKCRSPYWNHS